MTDAELMSELKRQLDDYWESVKVEAEEGDRAREEVARLRVALKFYADESNYDNDDAPGKYVRIGAEYEWETDEGMIARQALTKPKQQEESK